MRPVQGQIRLAMLLSVLSALCGLAALAWLALVLENLLRDSRHWPWLPMSAAVAGLIASYAMRLSAFNQSHYAAFRLEALLRRQLARHVALVSQGEIERYGAGVLSKVMQDDVKALHLFVADSTPLYARAFVTPVCTVLMLFWLDWRLALGAAAVVVAGFGVLALAMRNSADMRRRYSQARERVSAAIVEFVQAMPVVRSFDTGQASFGRYQQALNAYLKVLTRWYRAAGFSARFSFALLNPLPTLLLLLWLGTWLHLRGALDFATWVAVLLLGAGMAEAMLPMMTLNHWVAKARLSIARIQEVMALPVLPMPAQARVPRGAGITFENVSFSYGAPDSGDQLALRNVSFYAAPGTVTALVGRSGAGKTTVARLIPRFWDVHAGRVLIGGVDVREMTADTLMGQLACVFQETFLWAGSIADNIRLGSPEASLNEVIAAATAAQAHAFIQALPQGYATAAGDRGVFLSGGQRQRITIARAILQNRPILILDEATAFADPENEAALVAALSTLMRGKTVLIVAHRLSTLRDADQILVFARGVLVESGRHAELLAGDGVYSWLWHHDQRAQNWVLRARPSVAAESPR